MAPKLKTLWEKVSARLPAKLVDRLALFVPGALLTLGVTWLVQSPPQWFTFVDYKVFDVMLKARPKPQPGPLPVVVDLDEKTLAKYGQWPWPRYLTGLLLARLKQYGVAAAGMDMVFSEPDRTSLDHIQAQLKQFLQLEIEYTGLPQSLRDNDRVLVGLLGQGPYVLGYFFTFTEADNPVDADTRTVLLPPPRINPRFMAGSEGALQALPQALSAVPPLPELSQGGRWAGFFNSFPDHDNIVRWAPQVIVWNGQVYPGLAVATLMRAFGDKSAVLKVERDASGLPRFTLQMDLGELGRRDIPLGFDGRLLIDYRGPARTFPYISAADVLDQTVPREALAGKVAFIGTSVRGLGDIRATPLDASFVGVEAHANVADMIVSGRFLASNLETRGTGILFTAVFGLGVTVLLIRTRSVWVGLISLLAGAAMWLGVQEALNRTDAFISPSGPLLVLGTNFTLLTFLKFLREERQKRFIQAAFSHYLSPKVVDEIVAQPGKLTLTGEEKEMSILFSDVRGFTTISEKLSPTQVVDLLHAYFTPMTRLIIERSGTLDKFIGDAVMAFWNAPLDVPGHPTLAVSTALDMLDELDVLNVGFRERYGFEVHIGIGLNLGSVRVGNFGSADLFDYTIIGDNVNLCSRLEGLTKYYHQRLLLSQHMREGAGDGFLYQEVDRVLVKGKCEPVTIYTAYPLARRAEMAPELARWDEALTLYRECRFAESRTLLEELRAASANGLYELFADRCRTLEADPPAAGWNGVFQHTSK